MKKLVRPLLWMCLGAFAALAFMFFLGPNITKWPPMPFRVWIDGRPTPVPAYKGPGREVYFKVSERHRFILWPDRLVGSGPAGFKELFGIVFFVGDEGPAGVSIEDQVKHDDWNVVSSDRSLSWDLDKDRRIEIRFTESFGAPDQ